VLLVEGGLAIAQSIVVLDIIMDEGCFVEALDGNGGAFEVIAHFTFWVLAKGLVGGDGQEGSPAFSGAGQPLTSDGFRLSVRFSEKSVQASCLKPSLHFIMERIEI
jgi:hypothetical protein